jgi:4,5-DOPA dioxygenase extradiol
LTRWEADDVLARVVTVRQPAIFLGHGVPALLAAEGNATRAWMRRFGASLRATSPEGVVCVSAHFVAPAFTVTTSDAPSILDEDETASLSAEPRPRGSVALARRVIEHLLHAGLKPRSDPTRGLDHGAWLPLSLLFPDGDLPVVEVSLHESLDADMHFALGRALEPLRDEGFLVVGSGSLTYDLADRARIASDPAAADVLGERSRRFQAWVTDLLTHSASYARARGLTRFRDHPDAHAVQATGEHFLPVLVVAGAASQRSGPEGRGLQVHAGTQQGLSMAAFVFER